MNAALPALLKGLLAMALLATVTAGCASNEKDRAQIEGATYYAKGDLEATVNRDLDRVFKAARVALQEQEFPLVDENLTDMDAFIDSENPEDARDIKIKLEALTPQTTHVAVRYGILGNEEESTKIMRSILDQLDEDEEAAAQQAPAAAQL